MIDPTLLGLLIALGTLALADTLASTFGYVLPLPSPTSLPGAATLRRVFYSPTHAALADQPAGPAPIVDEPQYEHVEIDDPDRPFNPLAELAAVSELNEYEQSASSLAPTPLGPMTENDWYAAAFAEIGVYLDGFLDRRLPVALAVVAGGDEFSAMIDEIEREREDQTAELWHLVDALTTPTGEYTLVMASQEALAEALLIS
jgi:hypothetical protein